jgi:methylenetetrahydrofolate reductase (NADPH)
MPRPQISFEFMPPRSPASAAALSATVQALAPFAPDLVSVTCGAGGSDPGPTADTALSIARQSGFSVAPHVTTRAAPDIAGIRALARSYRAVGIRDALALRGDLPADGPAGGAGDSVALVAALAAEGLAPRVAVYPDPHPESRGAGADIAWLRAKVDAGAVAAVSQFFFEPETFLRLRDRVAAAGIGVPVLPGILPLDDWTRARRFAERAGVPIPGWLELAFDAALRDGRADLLALSIACETCDRLIAEGVAGLHFYTLNRAGPTRDICRALGLGRGPGVICRVA